MNDAHKSDAYEARERLAPAGRGPGVEGGALASESVLVPGVSSDGKSSTGSAGAVKGEDGGVERGKDMAFGHACSWLSALSRIVCWR